jgi:hypothetical protein
LLIQIDHPSCLHSSVSLSRSSPFLPQVQHSKSKAAEAACSTISPNPSRVTASMEKLGFSASSEDDWERTSNIVMKVRTKVDETGHPSRGKVRPGKGRRLAAGDGNDAATDRRQRPSVQQLRHQPRAFRQHGHPAPPPRGHGRVHLRPLQRERQHAEGVRVRLQRWWCAGELVRLGTSGFRGRWTGPVATARTAVPSSPTPRSRMLRTPSTTTTSARAGPAVRAICPAPPLSSTSHRVSSRSSAVSPLACLSIHAS